MFRSILRSAARFTSPSIISHPNLTHTNNFTRFSSFSYPDLDNSSEKTRSLSGCMAEVLEMLRPFDRKFPTSDVKFYVGLLRKCIRTSSLFISGLVHSHLVKFGLDSEIVVSNMLLDVYAKVGCLDSCSQLFDEMLERDLVSWCTVISGYVANGFGFEAYELFKIMLASGLRPNHFVVSSVLKSCSHCGVFMFGLPVHGLIIKSGIGFDEFVEIGLVKMYAKCGALEDARKVFNEIPVKSSASWNTMISGCIMNECLTDAVEICKEMCRVGFVMDLVTLRIVASVASAMELFDFCKTLHGYSIKTGFHTDSFVVAELVKLLIKLGEVSYMSNLFEAVKKPDASLCSLLVSGYNLHGHRCEAVILAEKLLRLKFNPYEGAQVSILNICLCKEEVAQIHCHIIRRGHLFYLCIGNALISRYSKFGQIDDATMIFCTMRVLDIVTWTAIIAGLVQNFQFRNALRYFHAFRFSGIQLDKHLVVTVINACSGLRAVGEGMNMHAWALKIGTDSSNFTVVSLLHMYAKCGYLDDAAMLFYCKSTPHDLVATNVMLAGYCWNSLPMKALKLFCREYNSGLVPDQFSFSIIFGACTDMKSLILGELMYCLVAKCGFEFSDVIVWDAIMNLYLKCRSVSDAFKFFYSTGKGHSNAYAVLMLNYIQSRGKKDDVQIFNQLQQSCLRDQPSAFARILKGCSSLSSAILRKQLRGSVSEVFQDNLSVCFQTKCNNMDKVNANFDEVSSTNALGGPMFVQYSEDGNKVKDAKAVEEFPFNYRQVYCSYFDVLSYYLTCAATEAKETYVADAVQRIQSNMSMLVPTLNVQRSCKFSGESWFAGKYQAK